MELRRGGSRELRMRRESPLFETPGPLLFLPLLLIQGGGMDLSRVGENLLSSVRSARSLGLLPSPSDRPEVPARAAAAAAAAVARALAGLPPHQRISLPSSSDELVSIYGSYPQDQTIEELEEDFYEEKLMKKQISMRRMTLRMNKKRNTMKTMLILLTLITAMKQAKVTIQGVHHGWTRFSKKCKMFFKPLTFSRPQWIYLRLPISGRNMMTPVQTCPNYDREFPA